MALGPDATLPFTLCAPQREAKEARRAIALYYSAAEGKAPRVSYASRVFDVACWTLSLRLQDADALASAALPFFHVFPIPSQAKISRRLLTKRKALEGVGRGEKIGGGERGGGGGGGGARIRVAADIFVDDDVFGGKSLPRGQLVAFSSSGETVLSKVVAMWSGGSGRRQC